MTIMDADDPDYYGFVFEGFVKVPETGIYEFFTDSDDGSLLHIDGRLIVNNDGLHGSVQKSGLIALEKGLHAIRVDFIERSGGSNLTVSAEGPGLPNQELGESVLLYR
jgi:hypothetical protein